MHSVRYLFKWNILCVDMISTCTAFSQICVKPKLSLVCAHVYGTSLHKCVVRLWFECQTLSTGGNIFKPGVSVFSVQVTSGFVYEDDMRLVVRQVRDRVMQVKRERERPVETSNQQGVGSVSTDASATQPSSGSMSAAQPQVGLVLC